MKCNKACTPPEWTETWPQNPGGKPTLNPRTGQPMFGTGVVKLKKGTGCVYTRDQGTGCCLLPTSGAVQPDDLKNPEIAAKRLELLAKAREEAEMITPDPESPLGKATATKPETW